MNAFETLLPPLLSRIVFVRNFVVVCMKKIDCLLVGYGMGVADWNVLCDIR